MTCLAPCLQHTQKRENAIKRRGQEEFRQGPAHPWGLMGTGFMTLIFPFPILLAAAFLCSWAAASTSCNFLSSKPATSTFLFSRICCQTYFLVRISGIILCILLPMNILKGFSMHFLSSNSQKNCLQLCPSTNSPFISIFFSILLVDMGELFLVGHSTLISSTPSVASYKGYEVITRQLQEMDFLATRCWYVLCIHFWENDGTNGFPLETQF